jgi:hypothetical protein
MMFGRELLQLLDGEPVADHLLIGDHVGRAVATVEQRHLAEGEPRAQGRHAALALSGRGGDPDLHADAAACQHEEQLRLVALADDDLALVEHHGRTMVSTSLHSSALKPLNTSSWPSANLGSATPLSDRASN